VSTGHEWSAGQRLAFSTLACPAWRLERAVQAALDCGYAGIELRLLDGEIIEPTLSRGERGRVRALTAGAGLPIVAVDTSIRLAGADPERAAADVRAFLDLAAGWESPLIRVFGGEPPAGHDREQVAEGMARLLASVARDAERAGVGIAVETHDALSSAEAVAALLARVASPAVGALWDILHTFRVGETPQRAAEVLDGRLLHVHVKDGRRRDGETAWDLVLLGDGEVPTGRCLRALRDRGYEGWLSVEWEKRWHPEIADPEVALPQHASALRTELASLD
jgi:sugar phosphate isomerase/epimerase